ncbi:MAG TPA: HYR domain-containing protein, partial [Bacteroidetes bacterium]|nr:HYR domain-containing protein [Bacteroidota bacterium]
TENCAASIISSHNPGDNFPVGTTVVTYTATDSSGNSSVCSFTLTVNMPAVNNQITSTPVNPCPGDTFSLAATSGFSAYLWSNGATTPTTTSSMAGWYWVDLTDSSNCTARDSFEVISGAPMPMISPMGANLCTGTFTTYQWYQNGNLIPGATNQCYFPTTNGTFQVVVTDSSSCQGISDTLIFVGLRDGFDNPGFEAYPNPAENLLNIRVTQPLMTSGEVLVYDLAGRIVQKVHFDQLQNVMQIDLGSLSNGSYIVEIASQNFQGRRRIIHIQ